MRVWSVVFSLLDEKTSYGQIAYLSNVSKTQTYRIVSWGLITLKEIGIAHQLEQGTNSIVISIGKNIPQTSTISTPEKTNKNKELIEQVITYLNTKTNRNYNYKTKDTIRLINGRITEGHTYESFKKVIDIKCEQWMGTDMENYLRPITLFGTKFNSYINERITEKPNNQSQIARTISTATKVVDQLGDLYEE
jgi:uncharacterized phage protein (TIGR02220 family)